MPPEGKPLSAEEIDTLKHWIAAGAKWEKHWAFVPPAAPRAAAVNDKAWVAKPDRRVHPRRPRSRRASSPRRRPTSARSPAARTSASPACRRPNEQLEAFLDDDRARRLAAAGRSLLASPHYGEHWARHWLDLVRFAETNSFERDGLKPNAWKYRDYVIRSFNDDKPYDQFLREQLAGDELDEVTDDSIIATGYYRLGIWDDEPADPLQARYDEFDDIVSTTSQVMLGLTVGCARCHDHKIDPIPQADYYGLLAFFADVTPYGDIRERDPAPIQPVGHVDARRARTARRAAATKRTRFARRCERSKKSASSG